MKCTCKESNHRCQTTYKVLLCELSLDDDHMHDILSRHMSKVSERIIKVRANISKDLTRACNGLRLHITGGD